MLTVVSEGKLVDSIVEYRVVYVVKLWREVIRVIMLSEEWLKELNEAKKETQNKNR